MSRGIHAVIALAVQQPVVRPFFAVELTFDTDPVAFWSGYGDLTIDGITYTGVGNLMQIAEIAQGVDISAQGATIGLSGIPSDFLADALAEPYQGRTCKIQFGVFDDSAGDAGVLLLEDESALLMENGDRFDISYDDIAFVYDLFVGRMDVMTIDEGGDTSTITLTVESRFIDLQKPRIRRYTDEDQRTRFSGDTAFQYVNVLQTESVQWGT